MQFVVPPDRYRISLRPLGSLGGQPLQDCSRRHSRWSRKSSNVFHAASRVGDACDRDTRWKKSDRPMSERPDRRPFYLGCRIEPLRHAQTPWGTSIPFISFGELQVTEQHAPVRVNGFITQRVHAPEENRLVLLKRNRMPLNGFRECARLRLHRASSLSRAGILPSCLLLPGAMTVDTRSCALPRIRHRGRGSIQRK